MFWLPLAILLCLNLPFCASFSSSSLHNQLQRRTAAGFNRDDVPTAREGAPTRVQIQMYIEGMSSFRSQSMDFHLDIYFQEQWVDPRLAHNGSRRILIKDPRLLDQFWHPDLYFANARTADFHQVTSPNFLVWIYPNGTVWYDIRVSMTVICTLNLVRYPFDSQSCTLRILSYAYDVEQLTIAWGGPVEKNPEILFPDMRLRKIVPRIRNDSYATGVWSCATAEFVLDRELVHHLIQSFLPSSLIVIVSWFNFWLDVECVPGRVSLSITTLLTLATQNSAERMLLPESGYVKASDVFSGACMAFVFSAMIEFTVVNYFTRRKRPWEKEQQSSETTVLSRGDLAPPASLMMAHSLSSHYLNGGGGGDAGEMGKKNGILVCLEDENGSPLSTVRHQLLAIDSCGGNDSSGATSRSASPFAGFASKPLMGRKKSFTRKRLERRLKRVQINRKAAQAIDRRCRLYFPAAFLIFNAVYWTYYLLIAKDQF